MRHLFIPQQGIVEKSALRKVCRKRGDWTNLVQRHCFKKLLSRSYATVNQASVCVAWIML